ncbi:hypothetical protein ACIPWF_09965 [Paenarthrobacter sp. NPDC089989]|uniref:hypothetical protein n=1 Tax=Paenarthrobacter sp. NPDC089989 TaxID=3364379 RepID=UPI0037FA0BEE
MGYHQLTYDDWLYLNPGDRVIVLRNGYAPQAATVDDVSDDASYFWLQVDGQQRVLVMEGDVKILATANTEPQNENAGVAQLDLSPI